MVSVPIAMISVSGAMTAVPCAMVNVPAPNAMVPMLSIVSLRCAIYINMYKYIGFRMKEFCISVGSNFARCHIPVSQFWSYSKSLTMMYLFCTAKYIKPCRE
jgi:hypothetical protein